MGVLTLIAVMLQSALGASLPQKTFPGPERAVQALIDASKDTVDRGAVPFGKVYACFSRRD
jgi:hypothetical protein